MPDGIDKGKGIGEAFQAKGAMQAKAQGEKKKGHVYRVD